MRFTDFYAQLKTDSRASSGSGFMENRECNLYLICAGRNVVALIIFIVLYFRQARRLEWAALSFSGSSSKREWVCCCPVHTTRSARSRIHAERHEALIGIGIWAIGSLHPDDESQSQYEGRVDRGHERGLSTGYG
jgi:hypothetical protein